MINYVSKGDVLDVASMPAAVASGAGILLATGVFGVACDNYASGAIGQIAFTGVFDLAADASTPTAFQDAYWDNTNKVVTTTTTSNTKIGCFLPNVYGAQPSSTLRVRLNGIAV